MAKGTKELKQRITGVKNIQQITRAMEMVATQKLKRLQSRADAALEQKLHATRAALLEIDGQLNGDRSRQQPGEKFPPIIQDRLFTVSLGVERSTYGPTPMHRESLDIATREIRKLHERLKGARNDVTTLGEALVESGAPWLEGGALPAPGGGRR